MYKTITVFLNLLKNHIFLCVHWKNSSAKYYQGNNERLQRKLVKDVKVFLRKKKKKKWLYGCERYKNFQKIKNKSCLSGGKNVYRLEKIPYFNFKKLCLFLSVVLVEQARYKKLIFVEIRVNFFFFFTLSFRKLARKAKLTVIENGLNTFYSTLNLHSFECIRTFFILCFISSYPRSTRIFFGKTYIYLYILNF